MKTRDVPTIDQVPEDLLRDACQLVGCGMPAPIPSVSWTREKSITRRGVLWLGQTCNLRCRFCYFIDRVADRDHLEHAFMPLAKAQAICRTLVDFYGNTAVDLQGGEPTLYPDMFALVSYCNRIGLAPTLITNALLLDDADLCKRYREAGVRDYLISVQGLGEVHDHLVGCPGAHRRQMTAIGHLRRLGIPFRFNVVMSKGAVPQLPAIARLATSVSALVVNFITFNPFADQAQGGRRSDENVPRYSEVRPFLSEAIDLLEEAGVEANVRYFPFCMVEERHRKNVYNFQQLSYDPHEWDLASWGWTGLQPQRTRAGAPSPPAGLSPPGMLANVREPLKKLGQYRLLGPFLYAAHSLLSRLSVRGNDREALYRQVARQQAQRYCGYFHAAVCERCSLRLICDGFHGDYVSIFDSDEATPLSVEMVKDSVDFIREQRKINIFGDAEDAA